MSATVKNKKSGKNAKLARNRQYVIDCAVPVKDQVFDTDAFITYLQTHIKAVKGGKAGQLGNHVTVASTNEGTGVQVNTNIQFAKRYVKFLTKKFLKKASLSDYVRVTAKKSNSYVLSYFNMGKDEGEETA